MIYNSKCIMITGVAGLIGSKFAEWVLDNTDYTVVGIDNLSGGLDENLSTKLMGNRKFTFYEMNVEDDLLDEIFDINKPDIVFHAAAYAAEAASPFIRKYNITNNWLGSANVINNCINHDVTRLVFLSSTAIYGVGNPPFKEDHTPKPIDPYGVAKFATEMDIEIAGVQHELDWCIIRPRNVYGIGQNIFDPLRNLFGIWMYRHLNGKPLLIYGDGLQTRMYTYIDDVLEGFWKACTEPQCSKQIINLGGIKRYTIKESAEMLVEIMGGGTIEYQPPRHEVKHTACDWQKSVDLLGFEHKTELRDGLTKMWNWVKTLPMRPRLIFDKYEVEKGLYPYWKQDALRLEDNKGYTYNVGRDVIYNGLRAQIISIDGAASASNPLSNYPMTIRFDNGTTQSGVYDHQIKESESKLISPGVFVVERDGTPHITKEEVEEYIKNIMERTKKVPVMDWLESEDK